MSGGGARLDHNSARLATLVVVNPLDSTAFLSSWERANTWREHKNDLNELSGEQFYSI